jgi:hypothetical protein
VEEGSQGGHGGPQGTSWYSLVKSKAGRQFTNGADNYLIYTGVYMRGHVAPIIGSCVGLNNWLMCWPQ